MIGDVYVKATSYLDALVYSNAGADVYLYFYDTDGLGDTIAGVKSCCGLGHAKELIYTWGATENEPIFPYLTAGQASPTAWELEFTSVLGSDIDRMTSIGQQDIQKFPFYTIYRNDDQGNGLVFNFRLATMNKTCQIRLDLS